MKDHTFIPFQHHHYPKNGSHSYSPSNTQASTSQGLCTSVTRIIHRARSAIRATHLELVEDQTTEAFLRAFRRFIGRRGVPETIISDNAKTFKAAAQDLETLHSGILSHTSTQKFLANNGIRWKFIAERAPWWGGFYERLIGMTKRCLKKTIGTVKPP